MMLFTGYKTLWCYSLDIKHYDVIYGIHNIIMLFTGYKTLWCYLPGKLMF